jgi:thymidylate synthase (FAD)
MNKQFPIDQIGFVELLDFMGSDLKVVNAARVSYSRVSQQLDEKDIKLLDFLMRNKHGSPFEHVAFTFRVKAPLFVVAQWERHRIASYNQQSGRYTQFEPEFYAPDRETLDLALRDYSEYLARLGRGVQKERARISLPQNLYTTFWFTINLRSLMNFFEKRNDDHAQWEIRQYAKAMERMVWELMPETYKAFNRNGRITP